MNFIIPETLGYYYMIWRTHKRCRRRKLQLQLNSLYNTHTNTDNNNLRQLEDFDWIWLKYYYKRRWSEGHFVCSVRNLIYREQSTYLHLNEGVRNPIKTNIHMYIGFLSAFEFDVCELIPFTCACINLHTHTHMWGMCKFVANCMFEITDVED